MNDDQILQLILTIAVVLLIAEQLILGAIVVSLVRKIKRVVSSAGELVSVGKDTLVSSSLPKPLRLGAAVWKMWRKK